MTEPMMTEYEHKMEKIFTHRPPKGNQLDRYKIIRDLAMQFAKDIGTLCLDSCERSLAITKIEEAVFWANAAIARNE